MNHWIVWIVVRTLRTWERMHLLKTIRIDYFQSLFYKWKTEYFYGLCKLKYGFIPNRIFYWYLWHYTVTFWSRISTKFMHDNAEETGAEGSFLRVWQLPLYWAILFKIWTPPSSSTIAGTQSPSMLKCPGVGKPCGLSHIWLQSPLFLK